MLAFIKIILDISPLILYPILRRRKILARLYKRGNMDTKTGKIYHSDDLEELKGIVKNVTPLSNEEYFLNDVRSGAVEVDCIGTLK
jgi:hypothetical protein